MPRGDFKPAAILIDLMDKLAAGQSISHDTVQKLYGVKRNTAHLYLKFATKYVPTIKRVLGGRTLYKAASPSANVLEQAVAVELAIKSSSWLHGTRYETHLRDLSRSLRGAVPAEAADAFQRMASALYVKRRTREATSTDGDNLETLLEAIRHRKKCRFEYRKLDGTLGDYTVQPWSLSIIADTTFLLAGKGDESEPRSFELSDMSPVTMLDETFVPPAPHETDFRARLETSIGSYSKGYADPVNIRLEVRGVARTLLRRRPLHSSQTGPREATGEDWSSVTLRVQECPELVSAILALLPSVRVVGPESLRTSLREAARAALDP